MSMDMMYGIVIVGFIVLVGLIGILSDTKSRGGLKWFLALLILVGGGVGVWRELEADKAAEKDKQKLADAVELAKSSNKLAEDEIRSHEKDVQAFAEQRDRLESNLLQIRDGAIKLIGQISDTMKQIGAIEKAAEKRAKPADLAEMGLKTRIEMSKNLVSIAKDAQWLDPPDVSKLEEWLREDVPLKPDHLSRIQSALKANPIGSASE